MKRDCWYIPSASVGWVKPVLSLPNGRSRPINPFSPQMPALMEMGDAKIAKDIHENRLRWFSRPRLNLNISVQATSRSTDLTTKPEPA